MFNRMKGIIQSYYTPSPTQAAILRALLRAFQNFLRDGITGTAASGMAYYFIFSVFPLTLLVAVFMGRFLGPIFAQEEITEILSIFFPLEAVQLIHDNIGHMIGNEQSFGLAALIGLTWSSLGVLSEVTRVLDNVFYVPMPRTFIQQRLIALVMIFMLLVMLVFIFLTLAALRLVEVFMLGQPIIWVYISLRFLPFGIGLLIYAALLKNIPNNFVSWNAVWPAAIMGAAGWEGVRFGLSWYIGNATRYSMIYGSISVVIVLLLWAYLMSLVFLLSAEICARLNEVYAPQNALTMPENHANMA